MDEFYPGFYAEIPEDALGDVRSYTSSDIKALTIQDAPGHERCFLLAGPKRQEAEGFVSDLLAEMPPELSGSLRLNLVGSDRIAAMLQQSLMWHSATDSSDASPFKSPETVENLEPDENGESEEEEEEVASGKSRNSKPERLATNESRSVLTLGQVLPARALWNSLTNEERERLASKMLEATQILARQHQAASIWPIASEVILLDILDEVPRKEMAKRLLEKETESTGLQESEESLAKHQSELTGKMVEIATETTRHMQRWRELSHWAVYILCVTTAVSILGGGFIIWGTYFQRINAASAALLLFALAIFAVSPVVLLLNERPLKGLDEWAPGLKGSAEKTTNAAGSKLRLGASS